MSWVSAGIDATFGVDTAALLGLSVGDYVTATIDKVIDARGVFYLLRVDGALAGMGGLRPLGEGVSELKRMYIRPPFRGRQLGALPRGGLLDAAWGVGGPRGRLASAPFRRGAHRLYRAAGFVDRGEYPETEVPAPFRAGWLFMERKPPLAGGGTRPA